MRWWFAAAGLLGIVSCYSDGDYQYPEYADVTEPGGETTDANASASSFGFSTPAANLTAAELDLHLEGDANFERSFIPAPDRERPDFDGLGPVFNNANCTACHQRDGRGTPPDENDGFTRLGSNESLFLRISTGSNSGPDCEPAFANDYCAPAPVPGFGTQLFHRGVHAARTDSPFSGQADVYVRYTYTPFRYPDGRQVRLRKPVFEIRNPYDNPGETPSAAPVSRLLQPDVLAGPRIGMPVFGLGLLEAVDEADILERADPDDADGDGISGRPNYVFDPAKAAAGDPDPISLGRFGWKANTPSVRVQSLGALANDIGVTNSLFPTESIAATPLHDDYRTRNPDDSGIDGDGTPEADPDFEDSVVFYAQTLHVPARRDVGDEQVRLGAALFERAQCTGCHRPGYTTGEHPDGIEAVENQRIWPFTDMLLHNMGEGLADHRPDFQASGYEWKARPLWGIGLTKTVNPKAGFLHDGRARTVEEAILWHGGEAERSKNRFAAMSAEDRRALLAFLKSL